MTTLMGKIYTLKVYIQSICNVKAPSLKYQQVDMVSLRNILGKVKMIEK